METQKRSIAKAISWRIVATFITGIVTYLLTGRLDIAVTIGFSDTLVKFFVYYIHERMWNRMAFGKVRLPDFEI